MTVMAACGIGPSRLYRPVMLITGLVAAVLAWLAFDARPLVAYRSHVVKVEAQRQLQSELIVPSRFRSTPDGRLVFYARSMDDDGTLHDIFIQRRRGEQIELAIAAQAVQRTIAGGDGRELVLLNGRRFFGAPGTSDMKIVTFEEHGIPVILPPADTRPDDPEMLPTLDLLLVGGPEYWAEIHWRLASPVSLIILALLAVPLARSGTRSSRYDRLGFAVLLYLIYSNLLGVAYSLVAKESTPTWLGYWWVHLPFILLVFLMMIWQSGWRPFRRRAGKA